MLEKKNNRVARINICAKQRSELVVIININAVLGSLANTNEAMEEIHKQGLT